MDAESVILKRSKGTCFKETGGDYAVLLLESAKCCS